MAKRESFGTVTIIPQFENVGAIVVRELGKADRRYELPKGTNDVQAGRASERYLSFKDSAGHASRGYISKVIGPKDAGVLVYQEIPLDAEDRFDYDQASHLLNAWVKQHIRM